MIISYQISELSRGSNRRFLISVFDKPSKEREILKSANGGSRNVDRSARRSEAGIYRSNLEQANQNRFYPPHPFSFPFPSSLSEKMVVLEEHLCAVCKVGGEASEGCISGLKMRQWVAQVCLADREMHALKKRALNKIYVVQAVKMKIFRANGTNAKESTDTFDRR